MRLLSLEERLWDIIKHEPTKSPKTFRNKKYLMSCFRKDNGYGDFDYECERALERAPGLTKVQHAMFHQQAYMQLATTVVTDKAREFIYNNFREQAAWALHLFSHALGQFGMLRRKWAVRLWSPQKPKSQTDPFIVTTVIAARLNERQLAMADRYLAQTLLRLSEPDKFFAKHAEPVIRYSANAPQGNYVQLLGPQ